MPFLGVCLGHQMLADALGGRVERMAEAEVGILEVELTEDGRADPLLAGLDRKVTCLQWHGCAVTELPEGGVTLASSDVCAIQSFRVGRHAWGIQYHVEQTPTTVDEWGAVPAYAASLEKTLGPAASARSPKRDRAQHAGLQPRRAHPLRQFHRAGAGRVALRDGASRRAVLRDGHFATALTRLLNGLLRMKSRVFKFAASS